MSTKEDDGRLAARDGFGCRRCGRLILWEQWESPRPPVCNHIHRCAIKTMREAGE